jgi:NAD(P)-dependent dehydrogenase (short-subunit alcohol dehydrogenase family)
MMNNAGIGSFPARHSQNSEANLPLAMEGGSPKAIWEYPEDWWDKTIAVNLTGVFLGTKYAALQMKDQKPHANGDRGWIINVASVLGLGGTPGSVGYVSSKHGIYSRFPFRLFAANLNPRCDGDYEDGSVGLWTPPHPR